MATKKILNLHEEITHRSLKEVCGKNGAFVFSKVRVADVLEIKRSGISDNEFRFALQAHFDFVITDKDHSPLFAVEFDGPSHATIEQQERDRLKNRLCDHLSFPLLRINARYLPRKYRNLDLLTWFVEVWFFQEAFAKAQDEGVVPPDEICDPFAVVALSEHKERFPLWLSAGLRARIQRLCQAGKCHDFAPSYWTGVDADGNYHGIMWLRLTKQSGVMTRSGIRAKRFPVFEREVLSEVMVFQLYDELDAVLRAESAALSFSEIDAVVQAYKQKYEPKGSATVG